MNNLTIPLFVGDPIREPSERAFVSRLRADLARLGEPATLYANFYPKARNSTQVDLLVRTNHRAAHVEIKNLRSDYPVRARPNGRWEQVRPDGTVSQLRNNCSRQALAGTFAISDAMAGLSRKGLVTGPDGAFYRHLDSIVGIWRAVPDGSDIETPPFVTVLGYEDLLQRLITPGQKVLWTADMWDAFARHHDLFQLEAESEPERRRKRGIGLIRDYRLRAKPMFARGMDAFVDLGAVDDQDAQVSVADIGNRITGERTLAVVGPSGSGKTFLAKHLAVRHCDNNHLVAWIEAGDYENRFRDLLARSMAPYSVERWRTLVDAALEFGIPITVVLDGLNECPNNDHHKLIRELRAFALRYRANVLITSTQDLDLTETAAATLLRINEPDDRTRREILVSHSARRPERIGPQFRTPYELSIAAQCESELSEDASVVDVQAAYVRRLAPTEQLRAGLRLLASRLHSDLRTSLSLHETNRLLNSSAGGLTPRQVDDLLACRLLVIEQHRVRFSHEKIGQFLAADDIVRSSPSGRALGMSLSVPANSTLADTALKMESDPCGVWEALKILASSNLVFSALAGTYGFDVADTATQEVKHMLHKATTSAEAAATTAAFEIGEEFTDGWWKTEDKWTEWEKVLMQAAGVGLTQGWFIDEIVQLIDRTDEVCLAQAKKLTAGGDKTPISRVFQGTYTQAAQRGTGRLAASHIATAFELAVPIGPDFTSLRRNGKVARRLFEGAGALSWGRFYLALLSVDSDDPSNQAMFASLFRRAWDARGYHLQLRALEAARHFARVGEPHRSEILDVVNGIETTHWALDSTLLEVLSGFGEIKSPRTVEDIRSEILRTISHPDDIDGCKSANGIVANRFEDEHLVGPYWQAIEELTTRERVLLFAMAARCADPSISFHLCTTLAELADLIPTGDPSLDTAAKSVFLPFLNGPPERPFMPGQAVDACLAAIRGWAKFEAALPPETADLEPRQRNWRLMANLLLAYEREDVMIDPEEIWRALLSEPLETLVTVAYLDGATPRSLQHIRNPIRQPLWRLAQDYQEPLRRLFEWALENQEEIPIEVARVSSRVNFVIRMLGATGDESTAAKLRKHTLDPVSGKAAVEAIRNIRSRVGS